MRADGSLASFADATVARLRKTPVDLGLLPPEGVRGSLFSGAAGVAFFLHEAARLRGEDDLHDRARAWCAAARQWADGAKLGDWRGSPHGFIIGATGLAFVEALLGAREGDDRAVRRALERIERASATTRGFAPDLRPTELYGGSAGHLAAAIALEQRLGDAARELARNVRARAVAALERATESDLLGMAHGAAGELWTLTRVLGVDHALVRVRLDELAAMPLTDRNGLLFWLRRRSGHDNAMLSTFCNGMPGQSVLFSEVARRTRKKRWLRLAAEAAKTTAVLTSRNPSLCCGLAGQSLALQRWADVSGDASFARRARRRIATATRLVAEMPPRHPYSLGLFQGTLGVVLVAMARRAREHVWPCFEASDDACRGTGA